MNLCDHIASTALILALALCPASLHAQQPSPPDPESQQESALPDVAGTWAQVQITSALSDVPVFGEVTTRTVSYLLLEVRQNGRDLVIDQQVCWIRIDSDIKKIRTVIPPEMTDAIGGQTRRGRITRDKDGWIFEQPRQWDALGVKLRVPDERLPTDEDDPRVIDADGDGNPGVTIRVVGLVDGEIYVVQRSWNALRGTIGEDHARVRGRVRWHTDQEVLDASSFLLDTNPKARPDPDPAKSHFRMRRVPAGTDCEAVIREHARLLDEGAAD